MLIIKTKSDSAFPTELELTEKLDESNGCWITVIVGENGARKSLLLRKISDDVLRPEEDRKHIKADGTISKLIALSGTPLDRFPRMMSRYPNRYSYFGLRAANNVAGTGQSEKSLVAALIFNRNRLKMRSQQLEIVFGQLGLKPVIKADFKISKRFLLYALPQESKNRFREKVYQTIDTHCERHLSNPTNSQAKKDISAASRFISDEEGRNTLARVLEELLNKHLHVTVSTSGNTVSKNTFPIAIWRVLLDAGIIELRGTWFQAAENSLRVWDDKTIPGSYLSSGQWSWLCTLGGLAIELEDNSAILIDEPENSLHPAWQRDYVPAIINILKEAQGCHVILATHSPLIASGLPPSAGNVRRLLRQNINGETSIISIEAPNTFGWAASDAYEELFELETTRAKLFNEDSTIALQMIKDKSGTPAERTGAALALRAHCETLPPLDPMRHAMESVAKTLERHQ